MKFIVIGGDAAGMSAASRAKRHDPELAVTVLEQTGDVSYSACGMPYNIADPQRSVEDLISGKQRCFGRNRGSTFAPAIAQKRSTPVREPFPAPMQAAGHLNCPTIGS